MTKFAIALAAATLIASPVLAGSQTNAIDQDDNRSSYIVSAQPAKAVTLGSSFGGFKKLVSGDVSGTNAIDQDDNRSNYILR